MSKELLYKIDNELLPKSEAIEYIAKRAADMDEITKKAYLQFWGDYFKQESIMEKRDRFDRIVVPGIGLLLLIAIIILVYFTPVPSMFQSGIIWIVIAIAASACAAAIPGFFEFKYKGIVRATGALGVLALIYFVRPVGMIDLTNVKSQKLHLYVAKDTSNVQNIDIDFDLNNGSNITEYSQKKLLNYYGTSVQKDTFTCYRKSDGMIYSSEKCRDLKEYDVLMISNSINRHFNDPRTAYLHFVKMIP